MITLPTLPSCNYRVRIRNTDQMFCNSPQASGEPVERPPYNVESCIACGFDKGFGAAGFAFPAVVPGPGGPGIKPRGNLAVTTRLTAAVRRCREAKERGEPCPDERTIATTLAEMSAASAPVEVSPNAMRWTCGLTTVPARLGTYLPDTLVSIAAAGFPHPRLFVDGDPAGAERFGLAVTARTPPVGAYGNWLLGLWELYIRAPHADRYAMFQDDFVVCRNTRDYLDTLPYPADGYWNLLTFPDNEVMAPRTGAPRRVGTHSVVDGPRRRGWFVANQNGLGAVALVFDRAAVTALLAHQDPPTDLRDKTTTAEYMVARPQNPNRGFRSIDGGVVSAMKICKRSEMCHYPSLVLHTGDVSQMGHNGRGGAKLFPDPASFPGAEFDAMKLAAVETWG